MKTARQPFHAQQGLKRLKAFRKNPDQPCFYRVETWGEPDVAVTYGPWGWLGGLRIVVAAFPSALAVDRCAEAEADGYINIEGLDADGRLVWRRLPKGKGLPEHHQLLIEAVERGDPALWAPTVKLAAPRDPWAAIHAAAAAKTVSMKEAA